MPGVVLVFSANKPQLGPLPLVRGICEIGRDERTGFRLDDAAVSREHAQVEYDGACWLIRDLSSRNGTYVDGARIEEYRSPQRPRVIRAGSSLFAPVPDVRPYLVPHVRIEGDRIVGPLLSATLEQARHAAVQGENLYVTGESGSGKEVVAREFHRAGPNAKGDLVAVNCATIPESLAERLLFGALKGAYSGADADTLGWVQAAHRGTLFLDEIGELHPNVQAKLLRVIETKEVLPLGASKPRHVDIRICSATLRDLRELVSKGKFREDLYYRIGRPSVTLPPLRERPEEIPVFIERELTNVDKALASTASLVEECLLRSWPGNVRELTAAVREAARAALSNGVERVERRWLAENAGRELSSSEHVSITPGGDGQAPSKTEIEGVLKRTAGNVSRAARLLKLHRTQLRRYMERYQLDAKPLSHDSEGDD